MGPKIQEILRVLVFSALRVVDAGLITVTFGLAAVAGLNEHTWATTAEFLSSKVSLSSCVLLAAAILMCYGVFSVCGLYKSKRISAKHAEVGDIFLAMTLSTAGIWLEGKLFSIQVVTPYFLVAFLALGSILIISTRLLLRYILGSIRKRGRNLHHILVLGTNLRAIAFGQKLASALDLGYRLLGFVDDDWQGMERFRKTGFRVVCGYGDLAEFLRHNVVDEIAIFAVACSAARRPDGVAGNAGILLRFDTDISI
jgi:FlaA1/EpsC-like NDP-sugar epimerase